jgi:hypothetical protein
VVVLYVWPNAATAETKRIDTVKAFEILMRVVACVRETAFASRTLAKPGFSVVADEQVQI